MKEKISVKVNYIYNVAYQLLLIVAPLITSPVISRRLGPEMIGQQSYCYSVATYFMMFIMLGVANYGNRCVARSRDDRKELSKTFWTIYGLQFIRACVVITAYIAFIFVFDQKYFLIALINAVYVFSGLLDISWLFFGLEQFKLTVPRSFVLKILQIIAILVLIRQPSDIWKYSLLIGIVTVLSNAVLWFYLNRFVDWYRPRFNEFVPHVKPDLILFIPVIAISLYKVMDRIMLGVMSNSTQVGYYSQAESVVNIPMSLITSLGVVMLPRISNLVAKGNVEETKKYIESSFAFAMMIACAMAFGLAAIAPTFATTFFGAEFAPCGTLMIGLSITIIFISWANIIRTQYLIPNSRDKSYVFSVSCGAIVNLCINAVLIPKYEAIGAVVATICAEAVVCGIQTLYVRKELPIIKYMISSIPFVVMSLIMFIGIRGITPSIENPFIQLITQLLFGCGSYCVMLLMYARLFKGFVADTINVVVGRVLNKMR